LLLFALTAHFGGKLTTDLDDLVLGKRPAEPCERLTDEVLKRVSLAIEACGTGL
jgi:hypothetical protein